LEAVTAMRGYLPKDSLPFTDVRDLFVRGWDLSRVVVEGDKN
jgi:hypothetical protein